MKYKFQSLQPILELFSEKEFWGVSEIAENLGKSKVLIHRYLKELEKQGKIKKHGATPKTKYSLCNSDIVYNENRSNKEEFGISLVDLKTQKILKEYFYKFNSNGDLHRGIEGFEIWCKNRGMNLKKTANTFIEVFEKIQNQKDDCGMLHAEKQFGKSFEKTYLNSVFYADQYIWLEFGRGKLAEMTFYAKQSQNKKLISESIGDVFLQLKCHIFSEKYDAIAITPWSIERKNQLLALLGKELQVLNIPMITLKKYFSSGIPIPQKSLKTRNERIQNAKNSIFVYDEKVSKYKKVLLIDDFVGSGATLNETAKKLKNEGIEQVDGFAFVGNLDLSYDVINEI